MKVFIDLFCGLGGASEAFVQNPEWKVFRIDNNSDLVPHVPNLMLLNVHETVELKRILRSYLDQIIFEHGFIEKLVIWASPPCQQYSYANAMRDVFEFDNTSVEAALNIIDSFEPNAWIIENVKGAIPTFNDIIGIPWCQRVHEIYLWGQFPLLAFKDIAKTWNHSKLDAKGSRALRPNYRALIPYHVSEALMNSLEHQKTLMDF